MTNKIVAIVATKYTTLTTMKEDLITFETAKLAKEKGFNERVLHHYDTDNDNNLFMDDLKNSETEQTEYSAPTQSLLQKWLREKHRLHVSPYPLKWSDNVIIEFSCSIRNFNNKGENTQINIDALSFEQALEDGLYEALKLI